jgi:hypothetical protein
MQRSEGMRRPLLALLVAAVATLVGSGTSLASNSTWDVYNWLPNGANLGPAQPASVVGGTVSFSFADGVYTATLVMPQSGTPADLTGTTVSGTVFVTGASAGATWLYQHGDGCTTPATVRFYFAADGSGDGTSFFTQFWWSNPISATLLSIDLNNGGTAATLSVPLGPADWSDWNGHLGTYSPSVEAAFNTAVTRVSRIGLSFGGGCFFENGVTSSDGSGTLNLSGFSD